MADPIHKSHVPAHSRVSGWSIAGAVGFHLLAGTGWFVISIYAVLDRYLFCTNEPGWLGPLFLVITATWVLGAILIGWVRSRGEQTWHWTLARLVLAGLVFMGALYSGPEPTDCGLF